MRIVEDAVWRHYGYPNPYWAAKCKDCRTKVFGRGKPVSECIDCWKIEIWQKGRALFHLPVSLESIAEKACLLRPGLMAKVSRDETPVVRSGVPFDGYPTEDNDYLLMIYARNIRERDDLTGLVALVAGLDCARASLLPVRRGCWLYDSFLGPWQAWFPLDKDCFGRL